MNAEHKEQIARVVAECWGAEPGGTRSMSTVNAVLLEMELLGYKIVEPTETGTE